MQKVLNIQSFLHYLTIHCSLFTEVEIVEVGVAAGLAGGVVEEGEFGAHEVAHVVETHGEFMAD